MCVIGHNASVGEIVDTPGDLGITTMRLITNNPSMFGGLDGFGLEITVRVSIPVVANPENIDYLRTKKEQMGHLLEGLD